MRFQSTHRLLQTPIPAKRLSLLMLPVDNPQHAIYHTNDCNHRPELNAHHRPRFLYRSTLRLLAAQHATPTNTTTTTNPIPQPTQSKESNSQSYPIHSHSHRHCHRYRIALIQLPNLESKRTLYHIPNLLLLCVPIASYNLLRSRYVDPIIRQPH
jgi:hypothetical protein